MNRIFVLVLAACGSTVADTPAPTITGTLAERTVLRNFIEPRGVEVLVEVEGLQPPFDIGFRSSDPLVLPDGSVRCAASPCPVRLVPSAERTAAIDVTLDLPEARGAAGFRLNVEPRRVLSAEDGLPAPEGSLRAALEASEEGDVVGFSDRFDAPQTITLQQPLLLERSVQIEGPGADRLDVSGDDAFGIFAVTEGVTLDLRDVSLVHGRQVTGGAVIAVEGSEVRLTRCRVADNTAEEGGGVAAFDARLVVDGCDFVGNTADLGGAISAWQGEVTVAGSTLAANHAETGAGIATRSSALWVRSSTLEGNTGEFGAAVSAWSDDDRSDTAVLESLMVRGNEARSSVLELIADTTLDHVTAVDNVSRSHVVVLGGRTNLVEGCDISGNEMDDGAALGVEAFSLVVRDTVIADNRSLDADADLAGVALYGNATFVDSVVRDNEATDGRAGIVVGSGVARLVNTAVTGNRAARYAGGIYVERGATLLLQEGSTVLDNHVTTERGGGIFVRPGATLEVQDARIADNSAHWGGGIWNEGSLVLHGDATIEDNDADHGGGLFLGDPTDDGVAQVELLGARVLGNDAVGFGGGVYVGARTSVTATADTRIAGNTAGEAGGGVYMSRDPMLETTHETMCVTLAGRITGNLAAGAADEVAGPDTCPSGGTD